MASLPEVIVYLYDFSPFGRRVSHYLQLRKIPHSVVQQPAVPPRPDLDAFGIRYRRIPILSIGRDFYCDTKLILSKLEQLYPWSSEHPSLGAKGGSDKALELLLQTWATDLVFTNIFGIIPGEIDAFAPGSPFAKDRIELFGGTWDREGQTAARPGAVRTAGEFFTLLETLIDSSKTFALGTEGPMLADIHALYIFEWLDALLPGALPSTFPSTYPNTFAWISRYRDALSAANSQLGSIPELSGDEAKSRILSAGFAEDECTIDAADPVAEAQSLKKGDTVEVWPEDIKSGYKHRDRGALAALSSGEVAVLVKVPGGEEELRVHFPRWTYKVQKVAAEQNHHA